MGRTFHVEMIKPSHYDDDGYVIQWWKASIPSNSLASLYAIVQDAAENRRVLGDGCGHHVRRLGRVQHDHLARTAWRARIAAAGGGIVFLVGVQSNQFPRAVDMARGISRTRPRRRHRRLPCQRLPVDAGHTAGRPAGGDRSRHHAVRRRGRGPYRRAVCATPSPDKLQPIYNFLTDLPGLQGAVAPYPAAGAAAALFAADRVLRCRPRLPVPVQLLHHHQRAGPQVALPHAPTMSRRCCAPISPKA